MIEYSARTDPLLPVFVGTETKAEQDQRMQESVMRRRTEEEVAWWQQLRDVPEPEHPDDTELEFHPEGEEEPPLPFRWREGAD